MWESLENPTALSPPSSLDFTVSHTINMNDDSGIVVSETIFSLCKYDDECTIEFLQQITNDMNSEQQVLKTIDELLTLYANAHFYCHPMAHHIGEFLYGYLQRNLDAASHYVDSICASGVLHGSVENTIAIENLLYDTPIDKVDYVKPYNTVGEKLGGHAKSQYIHGIGHSIIKAYDYDTVNAVKECEKYKETSERFMCRGGLFMQNIKEYSDNKGGD